MSVFVSESVIVVFDERHHICLVLFRGDGGRVRQQYYKGEVTARSEKHANEWGGGCIHVEMIWNYMYYKAHILPQEVGSAEEIARI